MLVLTRKKGESIVISDDIVLTVLSVDGENVKLGISAPKEIGIYRKEVLEAIEQNNQNAAMNFETLQKTIQGLGKVSE
ncbi:carbon storage regulator CsrA [Paenibacillus barcinonensis]|uniref:carbon storage regulator CsrA n=1 Tax=Paenibacillus TaxID=44249 RepID=UPI001C11EC99|nr:MULTISPECIES: carbon storage regulator CsrA [Paenibacillus]MBU5355383.1 carbon storage regulator CsrA [Paenibacillus barcinonensis]MDM5281327.1 carbon storage regulator CsrA [Paenibacillus silvae]